MFIYEFCYCGDENMSSCDFVSRAFKGSFSCKWVEKTIFFFHHYSIAYAFRNKHVKFQAGIRKIVEVMNFFCHVMFDLWFLELKTLNAFFSKSCFLNWRARLLKNSVTYFKSFYIGLNCIKFQIESRREKCEKKFFIPLFLNKVDEKKSKFCKYCCNFCKNHFFQKNKNVTP